jgi:hypothetical protein
MLHKDSKFDEYKLIEIFINVDDACIAMGKYVQSHFLESGVSKKRPTRITGVKESELITILIFYHYSGYKCFEYYYKKLVLEDLRTYFPKMPTYHRFLELIERVSLPMFLYAKMLCQSSARTGIYYIDSKKLSVCHPRRIQQHKVFKDIAQRGKSSVGWFYGFKFHLLINQKGEPIDFHISPANVADNNHNLLENMLKDVKGLCFGDKGYLSKLWTKFYQNGLKLVTKIKKNSKNVLTKLEERYLLAKRAVIESVNDIFTSVFDMEHSRHRKPINAFTHIIAAFCAYCFYPNKPSISI